MDLHEWLVNLCLKNGLEIAEEKTAEEICHFIVSNNAVNIQDQDGDTALMCAAIAGNTTICQLVLDGGTDVNMQNNDGDTALMCAAIAGNTTICQLVLDGGADVNMQNNNGSTPLTEAAYKGLQEVCLALIKKGANSNHQNKYKRTPLSYAAEAGHSSTCMCLIEAGSDVNVADEDGRTALACAAIESNISVCKMLVDAGADVNLQCNNGSTPLTEAAYTGLQEVCLALIKKGANSNHQNKYKRTPLSYAAEAGHSSTCMCLIEAGSDVNVADEEGDTALHVGALGGHVNVCQMLVDMAAAVDQQNNVGNSPLLVAALHGQTACCMTLVDAGCNVNQQNNYGENALNLIARAKLTYEEHKNAFVFFIKEGRMDISKKDKNGKSAFDIYNENVCDKYDGEQKKTEILAILSGGPLPYIEMTSSDITHKELLYIVNNTYNKWELIAANLGMTQEDINSFERPDESSQQRTYIMLNAWQAKVTKKSMRLELVAALRKAEEKDVADKIENVHVPEEILARGPEAVKAFQNALEEGQTEFKQGRTIFVGLENVGKTSTINSLLRKEFNPLHIITDAMVKTTVCTPDASNKEMLKETTQDISFNMYQDAVTNITVKQMLESSPQREENPTGAGPSKPKNRPEVNKREKNIMGASTAKQKTKPSKASTRKMSSPRRKEKPEIPKQMFGQFARKLRSEREGGDSQEDNNKFVMNIWDFGGQPIYHVIQRIFMVSYAVVCVVFNMKEGLNAPAKVLDPTTGETYEHQMTNLQFILFWIRSVFVNVRKGQKNKIMLIGTHYESLGKTEQERQQRVKEIENILWKALEGKPFEDMVYQGELFTIENSVPFEKSGASKIILQIQKFAQIMIRTLPIKWLQILQEIQQLRKEKLYLPTSEINDLLARCKKTDRKLLLEYLHDIGEILFYPDDKILKEKIVIDLMGVVDKFKTIITVIDPSTQQSLKQLWRNLNEGKLDEGLLRHMWKDESDEMIIFFVSLMQTFGLMCEKKTKKNVGRTFYVLSRLKPQRDDTKAVKYEEKRAISLFHDFDGYLPDDLFQRVATKFIEEFQMKDVEPTLSYEHVELNVDGHHLVVLNVATINNCRLLQTTIVRTDMMNAVSKDDDPKHSICKKVLTFLEKELHVLSEKNAHGFEVKMYIPCVCASKGEHTHMHVVRKFNQDVLPCGSRGMEVKRYRKLFGDNVLKAFKLRARTKRSMVVDIDDNSDARASTSTLTFTRRLKTFFSLKKDNKASPSKEAGRQKDIDPESDTDDTDTIAKAHKTSLKSKVKGSSKLRKMSDVKDNKDYVDDLTIDKVSREMDLSCRRFGVRLGLTWSKVNTIFDKEQTDKATANMVEYWRSSIGSDLNQQQVLCTALRQHDRNDLAKQFEKYIKDELPQIIKHSACFDDQDLLFICDNLGESWRRLAVRLGIKWENIGKIAGKNKHVEDAMMEVLVQWRNSWQHAEAYQLPTMIKALKQQGRVNLADSLCTRHGYKDDVSSEVPVFTDQSGQGCLTDLDFLIISQKMTEWKSFCRSLGIADVELSQNERRFSALTVEATMESLVQWRCKQGRDVNQREEVIKALRAVERMDIVQLLETV